MIPKRTHIKLESKFGRVSNVRAERENIRFDRHGLRKGKEVRTAMSVLIKEFV